MRDHKRQQRGTLEAQMRWFVGLRWLAGAAVILAALADGLWVHMHAHPWLMLGMGAAILVYNLLLWQLLRRNWPDRPLGLSLAAAQILLDLSCLTALAAWTGGVYSPVLGFYVFHMVFASLLLTRLMAYAAAAAAMAMLLGTLALLGQLPSAGDPNHARLILGGWAFTVGLTVFLANHITQSLRRHRRRLVRQNRRIRALAQRLRRQQQAMIQHEKMAALGQMAAGVAHEVANPLANMDGLLQLAQRQQKTISAEQVGTLRQQIDRIRQTVHQMTSFAHPTELSWDLVPVNQVVESGLELVRLDRRMRQTRIEKKLTADNRPVRIQPHAMQQVLINVLINALDAVAQTPGPRLTVGTEADPRKGECRITITDNGPGIPAEYMDRLFEPFFTTKPVGQGTGLGLAISYSLMRSQGGRILISSQLGQGTTVTLVLPTGGVTAAQTTAATPAAGPGGA